MAISLVPPAAVGAISAALIGALLAFLSLLIAKENKTSEFRQAWIDALRQDLASMLGSANAIRGAIAVGFSNKEDLYKATERHFVDAHRAATSIRLRLNHSESASKLILSGIDRLEVLTISNGPIDIVACAKCERELLVHAQSLLKIEWMRVRRGETLFYITKSLGLVAIIGGLAWAIWIACQI